MKEYLAYVEVQPGRHITVWTQANTIGQAYDRVAELIGYMNPTNIEVQEK